VTSDLTIPINTGPDTPFVTTQWTRVLEASGDSPEAQTALSELCGAYYVPVVAFLHRSGRDEDIAREQAHEFFAYLLARDALAGARRERGRFRSYLLGALKHFLAREHERASRQKRGGGMVAVPLDEPADDSPALVLADSRTLPPDEFFDRQWALAVLDRALAALEHECADAGKANHFERLKPWLAGAAAHGDQAATARTLGLSEGALKVAVHRLRLRFRALVKAEVAQTLDASDPVEDELQQLFIALSCSPR
jgi:DNA-directed RNA polymerase specialized sigma24 family protein